MANIRRTENMDQLFEAILELKDIDECYAFFEDLCTVPELESFAQRIKVAKMLMEGKVYSEIVDEIGASTATISRVKRSLAYGCDGYKMVFGRLGDKQE